MPLLGRCNCLVCDWFLCLNTGTTVTPSAPSTSSRSPERPAGSRASPTPRSGGSRTTSPRLRRRETAASSVGSYVPVLPPREGNPGRGFSCRLLFVWSLREDDTQRCRQPDASLLPTTCLSTPDARVLGTSPEHETTLPLLGLRVLACKSDHVWGRARPAPDLSGAVLTPSSSPRAPRCSLSPIR